MKHFFIFFFLLIISSNINAQKWESEYNAGELAVFSATEGSNIYKTYKGTMRVKTTSDNILDVMRNVAAYNQWTYGCIDSKVLKPASSDNIVPKSVFDDNTNYTFYIYTINEGSPLDNRDAIARVEMSKFSNDKVVLDIFGDLQYIPENKDLVRLKALKAKWIFERDPNNSDYAIITHQLYNDPDVPMWVPRASVNSNTYDVVKKTLEGLKARL